MFWKVVCVCCSMHDAAAAVSVVSDCNPKDCSPPGAVHGILQASILGWVFLLQEIFLTRGRTCISCVAGRFFSPEPPGSPRVQYQFSSVHFSRSVVSDSLRPHESQHARPPCPSPSPGVHSDSRPLSQWCHSAISSSVIPFSSCPQSLPA